MHNANFLYFLPYVTSVVITTKLHLQHFLLSRWLYGSHFLFFPIQHWIIAASLAYTTLWSVLLTSAFTFTSSQCAFVLFSSIIILLIIIGHTFLGKNVQQQKLLGFYHLPFWNKLKLHIMTIIMPLKKQYKVYEHPRSLGEKK